MRTALVLKGTAIERIEIAGTLQALPGADVKLGALSAGRLLEMRVGEGDPVRSGELLARIDPAPLRAASEQAHAQLDQARAQEENSKLHARRAAQALDAGVAPRQELEDAELALATAHAQVKSAQGALSAAENQLARSELHAPFDGIVAHVFAAQGEIIDAGRQVIEVARTRELELRGAVAARIAARLRPGLPAAILAAGARSPAQVLAVAPVIDAATGAATVRLRVDNRDGALKVGEVARAQIVVGSHDGALLVPQSALLAAPDSGGGDSDGGDAGGEATVCIVDGESKARCVAVQTRPAQDGQVEIVDGIAPDARVILQGAYALPDGTRVRTDPAVGTALGTGETSRAKVDAPPHKAADSAQ